jgi:2-hydroxy-3-oxopropionate reductase
MTKIAFIGLGIMGRPMAGHLKTAGHDVTVVERPSLTAADREAFAVAPTIEAATSGAEVVITMVPDTPDVERVLFGAHGVAAGLAAGTQRAVPASLSLFGPPAARAATAGRYTSVGDAGSVP